MAEPVWEGSRSLPGMDNKTWPELSLAILVCLVRCVNIALK